MPNKDVEITASGMRKRTARGKKNVEARRREQLRRDQEKRDEVTARSRKIGRGEEYKKCRKQIREAADRGEEYTRYGYTITSSDHISVREVTEALAAKLKKAGFKTTVIWPKTETSNMGDFNAPCNVDFTSGGVEVSWGPGEGHNKPRDRRWGY